MKSRKLPKYISRSIRLMGYLLLLLVILSQPLWLNRAFAKADQLTDIEQRLFFRDYSSEDEACRLSRIEKQIFGETHTGEMSERLKIIYLALPQFDLNSQTGAAVNTPKPASAIELPEIGKPGIPFKPTSAPGSLTQLYNGEESTEQERMAALAAKQREIDELMSQGVALWKAKKSDLAIDKFAQVVRLDPQNAQALFSLGVAFEAKGDFAQAKSSYQLAHVLEPENKDYIEALAAIDKKSAQSEQLVHGQSQLRQLADDAASAYQRGEYLSALDLYRQLDEQDPNQALVKWNIGSLYLTIKNAKMALKYYKEAVKLKPDDDRYKQTLKRLEEEIHAQAAKERETGASSDTSSQPGAGQIDKRQEKKQREHQAKAQSKNNPVDLLLQYGITAKHSKDGAHIIAIGQNSRAAQVGLKEDDLIKAVDGAVTTSGEQINRILLSKPTGARFQFTVQRGARLGQILF